MAIPVSNRVDLHLKGIRAKAAKYMRIFAEMIAMFMSYCQDRSYSGTTINKDLQWLFSFVLIFV